ncbi:hypothetical protein CIL05_17215 [Virgibacillus profundi]|uniref:HTH cro/C1-type domain-containing protein n=1 Tax=Virgibacillus profundi TaxID=2024555 RepID=A0A2A2I9W9_9BACI|nr:helix-turn-helix transcriptional regulator [Virgibacillus profundi]PAV28372.1 hypothetical protein CIL05_17215 [Virgibacillus profundi]PXY52266.1 XRE family transcriptional regulator [Virgibacillus profundi]
MDINQFTIVLGKSLKEYRIKMGLTIGEVANIVNMDDSHLSSIEKGKHIPMSYTLIKLAAALNIPGDFFDDLTKGDH